MVNFANGMRLKSILSHEMYVTQTSREVTKLRALIVVLTDCATCACKHRVLVVDVI